MHCERSHNKSWDADKDSITATCFCNSHWTQRPIPTLVLMWSQSWGHGTSLVGRRRRTRLQQICPFPLLPSLSLSAVVGGTNHTEWSRVARVEFCRDATASIQSVGRFVGVSNDYASGLAVNDLRYEKRSAVWCLIADGEDALCVSVVKWVKLYKCAHQYGSLCLK